MARNHWVVRAGQGGRYAEDFERLGIMAVGFDSTVDLSNYASRSKTRQALAEHNPDWSQNELGSASGQLYRFAHEIGAGDVILTPIGETREILVGIAREGGEFEDYRIPGLSHARDVEWLGRVSRDELSHGAANSAGSLLTVFSMNDHAEEVEILAATLEQKATTGEEDYGEADSFTAVRGAFQELREGAVGRFTCELRRFRAAELRELLRVWDQISLETFNREVWAIESETRLDGQKLEPGLTAVWEADEPSSDLRAEELLGALESDRLELHGNYMWRSGSGVYGAMLQRDPVAGTPLARLVDVLSKSERPLSVSEIGASVDALGSTWDVDTGIEQLLNDHPQYFERSRAGYRLLARDEARLSFVRKALALLVDEEISPLQKTRSIMEVPGFGANSASGLVMLFHPTEWAIYNQKSRSAVERLGRAAADLEEFQGSVAALREELDATDFLELDYFLWCFEEGIVTVEDSPAPTSRVWWVNQGRWYDEERELGYLWASPTSRTGAKLPHHANVAELEEGDAIIHYAEGALRAIGRVVGETEERRRPVEDGEGRVGYYVPVSYADLAGSVRLDDIPLAWRTEERGPFNRKGRVNQGYLYPVSREFVGQLGNRFPALREHLPFVETVSGYEEPPFAEIVRIVEQGGLKIGERLLRRYHLALKTRGFVILSGVSGTGKTWLTDLYARAAGARYKLVPVAPNWTSNEDLLGYYNPFAERYQHTEFSRFLIAAAEEYEHAEKAGVQPVPYHLALDEMNLARVEYYFARFLSALEVRSRGDTALIELGPDQEVALPPNLIFVGTVNVDETTHGFADKVFDRAQLLELEAPRELLRAHLGEAPYRDILMDVWDVVEPVAPFAFRVMDEIVEYVDRAMELGVTWRDGLDEAVVQKVIPKLRGADPRIEQVLAALVDVARERLPITSIKAEAMADVYRAHGFTSFF